MMSKKYKISYIIIVNLLRKIIGLMSIHIIYVYLNYY
jgi:hypothetical protein